MSRFILEIPVSRFTHVVSPSFLHVYRCDTPQLLSRVKQFMGYSARADLLPMKVADNVTPSLSIGSTRRIPTMFQNSIPLTFYRAPIYFSANNPDIAFHSSRLQILISEESANLKEWMSKVHIVPLNEKEVVVLKDGFSILKPLIEINCN